MAGEGQLILYYVAGIGLIGQLCLLYLQVRAYLRNRHRSFAMLAASTVLGLLYLGAMFAPYLFPTSTAFYLLSGRVAAGVLTVQLVVGIWGAASLFNSYGTLVQRSGA